MLQIAQTLAQLVLHDQFKKCERTEGDFKAWVASQSYYIDQDLVDKHFVLRVANDDFFKALGHDCDKFTKASIETFSAIQANRIFKRNSSWPFINAYYSAFFAAHSLLRAFGMSFSQLSPQHMDKIYKHAQLLGREGGTVCLTSGFHKAVFDAQDSTITFEWVKDSHADLWATFLQLLQRLIHDIPKASAVSQDKLDTINLLSDIKHVITQKGARGNWLSMIRNEVNYQSAHGTWFPYSQSYFDENILLTEPKKILAKNSSTQLNRGIDHLHSAFDACIKITNLMVHLIRECNQRFSNENYNFKNGSMKMLNMLET